MSTTPKTSFARRLFCLGPKPPKQRPTDLSREPEKDEVDKKSLEDPGKPRPTFNPATSVPSTTPNAQQPKPAPQSAAHKAPVKTQYASRGNAGYGGYRHTSTSTSRRWDAVYATGWDEGGGGSRSCGSSGGGGGSRSGGGGGSDSYSSSGGGGGGGGGGCGGGGGGD